MSEKIKNVARTGSSTTIKINESIRKAASRGAKPAYILLLE